MRRIENQGEREKRQKRNRMIIGIILAGIMILSTAGYAFYSSDKESKDSGSGIIDYNGLEFINSNGFWKVNIQNQNFYFQHLPNETAGISSEINKKLQDFSGKILYISEESEASQEIAINLGNYVSRISLACLDKCDNGEDWVVKNCSDNFIIFKNENIEKISQEENCIFISSDEENKIKASDAFIYKIVGII